MTSAERTPARAQHVFALALAAALVAVEVLALFGVGVSVVLGSDRRRLLLDVTTTVFFVLYGSGLLACAWGLLRVRRWARAPVVLAQLIQILVAWSFYPGETRLVALALAATAVVVLVAVLSPPATRALVDDEPAA